MRRLQRGFTLIELLVVVAIIALLIGVLMPALAAVKRNAEASVALTATRTLAQAMSLYAIDHDQSILPAHLAPGEPKNVLDEAGNPIGAPVNQRWVYRLAPYFDYVWAGTTHIGKRRVELLRLGDLANQPGGMASWAYEVSVFPSFGMNHRFVGGDFRRSDWIRQKYHVTRMDKACFPTLLLAFSSSRFNVPPSSVEGYADVDPPQLGTTYDERNTTASPATGFGFVHPRYGGRAALTLLDGHAELMKAQQMLDRRRWCDTAARMGQAEWNP